jgi:hypothetical protein
LSPHLAGKYFGVFVALALALPALAQSAVKPSLAPAPHLAHAPKETSTTLRVLILVSGLLVLLVVVSRWKKIRRLSSLSHSAWPASTSKRPHPTREGLFSRDSHRRRRRRREHRQRNPTLAETGGLPPIRSEIQPPPPT